jgi:hypothetical protein
MCTISPVRNVMAENLLPVLSHLSDKDLKIIKLAVDKCGSNLAPTPESALPFLCREHVIDALRKLSMVCGYGTTAVHATLKKLQRSRARPRPAQRRRRQETGGRSGPAS